VYDINPASLMGTVLLCPPSKKRGHCFAHVGRSVCLSVGVENAMTYLPQTWSTHSSWAAEELY